MARIHFLSYTITKRTPVYPGDRPVSITKVRQMRKGDSCNTSLITISNHAGTHIDVPRHFFEGGKSMGSYKSSEFIFKRPYMMDCPKGFNEEIRASDLKAPYDQKNADIVIIRTGFGKYRERGSKIYCHKNPYLLPEAAKYLIRNFPCLRAVGIDTVSVSSKTNSKTGRESHRILLGKGLLIIEDMRLLREAKDLDEIIAFPMFAGCLDGSPCIVMGLRYD